MRPRWDADQTEMQTIMLEKILNLVERTRTIEHFVYEVFITNRVDGRFMEPSGASSFAKRAAPSFFLSRVHG